MDNHIFRSAALGFNRQDVMDYIERVQKESETKIEELTAQLDAARQECYTSQDALEDCSRERDRLNDELAEQKKQCEAELADLKAQCETEKKARKAAESKASQQEDQLRELTAENELLTEQAGELEGHMQELRREKERLTQIELDARRRSDELLADTRSRVDEILSKATAREAEIQEQAQAEADMLLSETRTQIAAAVAQCEDLLQSFEAVTAHVRNELQKMDETAAQLPASMEYLKNSLADLMELSEEEENG